MPEPVYSGGCLCGALRYQVTGAPYKSGVCHCRDCKKVTGTSFLAYADWRPNQFISTGEVRTYEGRSFCPVCGSRLFSTGDNQVEIYLGTLDDTPTIIGPEVEGWVIRREHWLQPINTLPQYERDIP
jgi:hypothetical protein